MFDRPGGARRTQVPSKWNRSELNGKWEREQSEVEIIGDCVCVFSVVQHESWSRPHCRRGRRPQEMFFLFSSHLFSVPLASFVCSCCLVGASSFLFFCSSLLRCLVSSLLPFPLASRFFFSFFFSSRLFLGTHSPFHLLRQV